jgi:hypothetical protein
MQVLLGLPQSSIGSPELHKDAKNNANNPYNQDKTHCSGSQVLTYLRTKTRIVSRSSQNMLRWFGSEVEFHLKTKTLIQL